MEAIGGAVATGKSMVSPTEPVDPIDTALARFSPMESDRERFVAELSELLDHDLAITALGGEGCTP